MADIVAALNKLIEIEQKKAISLNKLIELEQKKAISLEVIKVILNKIYEAEYLEDI